MSGSGMSAADAYAIGVACSDCSFLDLPITRHSTRSVWSLAHHEEALGFPPLVKLIPDRWVRVATIVSWLTLPWRSRFPNEPEADFQTMCELRVVIRVSLYREALARLHAGVDRDGRPANYAPDEIDAANAALWTLERWGTRIANPGSVETVSQ